MRTTALPGSIECFEIVYYVILTKPFAFNGARSVSPRQRPCFSRYSQTTKGVRCACEQSPRQRFFLPDFQISYIIKVSKIYSIYLVN